jgi:hypothetical protein
VDVSAGFRPYIYGATAGTPSKGRPERVLAAGLAPETAARRFERELGEAVTSPAVRGRRASQPCGKPAAYRRHLRHGEQPCGACRAAQARQYAARKETAA